MKIRTIGLVAFLMARNRTIQILRDTPREKGAAGSKERITDPIKIVGIGFAVVLFAILYQVPSFVDAQIMSTSRELGLNLLSMSPLSFPLKTVALISWWIFLLGFVIVNGYQVAWAGIGFKLRERRELRRKVTEFNPSVDVVIPVYNEARNIERTLTSCLTQTYSNMRKIIVVDDGSSDSTGSIVRDFELHDNRITYCQQEKNMGKPAALNRGFELVTAELTFFMDGDSSLESHAIELLVLHFKDPMIGCVASLVVVANNGGLLAKMQEIEYAYTQMVTRFCQSLEKAVLICPGAGTMVRTEIARKIRHRHRTITEDADFTFEVHRSWRVAQEPNALSYTTVPTSWKSLTNQRLRWLYGVLQTLSFHRWAISKFWVAWAWLGYLLGIFTFILLASVPLMVLVFGYGYLVILFGYALVGLALAWIFKAAPLLWYPRVSKKLVLLVPIYFLYEAYLNLLQMLCAIAKITRTGVIVTYGPQRMHAR